MLQISRIWLSLALLLLLVFSGDAAFARGTLEGSEILRECRKILMVDKELDKLISSAAAALVAGKMSALELSRRMEEIIPRLNDLEELEAALHFWAKLGFKHRIAAIGPEKLEPKKWPLTGASCCTCTRQF